MQELIIEAKQAQRAYWKDLWRYRELFYFLAWRDLLVRYKQTVVGVAWSLIRPLLTMLVLTIVFGIIAKLPVPPGVPYPILVFCGMLPWQFFAMALSESGNSLVNNRNLVSKVYFPRLIVPSSSVITSLVDFFISAGFLVLLMVWYQFLPSPRVVLLPLFVILAFAAALGVGLWTAALMVKYRDFRFIVPFVVQFGLYASPVGWTSNVVPEQWRMVYSINPMVGVIDGFRWAILGGAQRASTFSAGEIVDFSSLAFKLKYASDSDKVSQYLSSQLADGTKAELERYQGGFDKDLRHALVADFNRVIANGPIYEEERFSGIQTTEETRSLLAGDPEGEALARLNRLLLEDTYPREISRERDHVMNWPGFMVSCLIVSLLLVTGLKYFRKTEREFADVI